MNEEAKAMQDDATWTESFEIKAIEELYFFCDVETGGFDKIRNALLSLCFIVTDKEYNIKDEFEIEICPYETDQINHKALEVNGFTLDQVLTFTKPKEAAEKIIEFVHKFKRDDLKKHKFIYHANPKFDWNFLEHFLRKGEDQLHYELWKVLDDTNTESTMSMAKEIIKKGRTKYNLKDLAKFLEIEFNEDEHHTARFDTHVCMQIHRKLLEMKDSDKLL